MASANRREDNREVDVTFLFPVSQWK